MKVPVDMEAEENEQRSVDSGHSPWKLDPVYVAQVFISLEMSPNGIEGDYPVQYENLKTGAACRLPLFVAVITRYNTKI